MKKQLCGLGVASLLLLASCGQPQNTLSENSDKTASGQTEQKISDASKADWSKAKFENEDADLYLPSENTIPLPENIEENALFIKPSFQNVKNDQKIKEMYFGFNFLVGDPFRFRFDAPEGFEGEFGVAVNTSKEKIPTTIETTITNLQHADNIFFGELLLDTKNGKFQKMWKFFAPKNKEMRIDYVLHDMIQSSSVPEKIVMDISDVTPYVNDDESELSFPIYAFGPGDDKNVFPIELRAKTRSGETMLLKRGNKEERNENVTTDCLFLDRVEGPYYPSCHIKAKNAWLKNIVSLEAIYDKRVKLQKSQPLNIFAHKSFPSPMFYGDEKTREGRKGIAYNPKLPFTLPEKPTDNSALLVIDAKVTSGAKNFVESIEAELNTMRGFASAAVNSVALPPDMIPSGGYDFSNDSLQQDSFFFHPNAQEDFLEASTYFLGKEAIKGKVLRMPPSIQESRYETFFIAKEGDFYHIQTEAGNGVSINPYTHIKSSDNAPFPKKFVFDISRMKDLWNTIEQSEIFNALHLTITTKPTEKIKTVKVIFYNGEIREVPLGGRDNSWDIFEKEGFAFSQPHDQGEYFEYELQVSNKHAKNISKVEVMFE